MIIRRAVLIATSLFLLVNAVAAQDLHLIPAPRELQTKSGSFKVEAATRIVVGARHAIEDRFAAEQVAAEIENATGRKLRVTVSAAAPGPGSIWLARTDEPGMTARLKAAGLDLPADFNEEGYVLEAAPARITVAARTGAGLFYGAQTLRQLLMPDSAPKSLAVSSVTIRDWPQMRWRGVHDDVSRGPIPTLDYMKKEVRTLAEYKVNLWSPYLEHVFDYASQPLVAPHEASIKPEEMKDLIAYAQNYHVTIMPEQEPFGHLHHMLKYEVYQDVAETPHGHVLTPTNPRSFEIVKSMFTELAGVFPSPLFHIGSDETFELGQGKTKELATKEGLGKVYLDDIVRLYDIMKPYHRRLLFWADIAQKYPQLLGVLPKDMIADAWEYDAWEDYSPKIKPFRDAGLEVFVSPGSNSWYHVWPDQDVAFVNVRNFVRDGQKFGAIGMLNTTWDDDGEAFFGSTWPAMILGAACSWQQGECNIQKFLDDYDWAFYRNPQDHTFRDVILHLNKTNAIMKQATVGPNQICPIPKPKGSEFAHCSSPSSNDQFWLDPFTPEGASFAGHFLPYAHDYRIAAETALASLQTNRSKARLHADSLQYMIVAAMRLDYLGMKVQLADEINRYYRDALANQRDRERVRRDISEITSTNGRLQDLRDGITRLRKFYSDLWLSESEPYWLANVQVRYDRLALLFTNKIEEVKAATRGGTLAPPEQLGFFDPIAPPPPGQRRGGPGAPAPGAPGAQPTQPSAAPVPGAAQPQPAAPATGAQPGAMQQIPPTQPAPAPPPSQKPPEKQ